MICPSCKKKVEDNAWICTHCEHILDASVLDNVGRAAARRAPSSAARPAPWDSHDLEPPEAMILGDATVSPEDFELVSGAGAGQNGKTATFLFYAAGGTSRVLRPTAIPELAPRAHHGSVPNTPYEDFILTFIDGVRTVREILRSSGLEPSEVTVTLLTLLDKRQVVVRNEPGGPVRTASQLSVPGADLVAKQPSAPPPPDERPELDEPTKALELPPSKSSAPAEKSNSRPPIEAPSNRLDSLVQPPPLPRSRKVRQETTPIPDLEAELPPVIPQALAQDEDEVTELAGMAVEPPPLPSRRGKAAPRPGTPPPWERPVPDASTEPEDDQPPARRRGRTKKIDDADDIPAVRARRGRAKPDRSALPAFEDAFDGAEPTRMEATPPLPSALHPEPPPQETPKAKKTPHRSKAQPAPRRTRGSTKPPKRGGKQRSSSKTPDAVALPLVKGRRQTDEVEGAVADAVKSIAEESAQEAADALFGRGDASGGLDLDLPDLDLEGALEDPDEAFPQPPIRHSGGGMPAASVREGELAISAAPDRDAPMPLARLDSAFLAPVRPSEVGPAQRPSVPPQQGLPSAQQSPAPAPHGDRVRRPHVAQERSRPDRELPKRMRKEREAPKKIEAKRPVANPADGIRMAKAQRLFEEALKDKADGNPVSARMNMKLALTFDPTNPLYIEAFEDLSRSVPSGTKKISKARVLYDKATDYERMGEIDKAVQYLEDAIKESKEPAFYNRLGVILAMKKFEFVRAQKMIETALEIAPGNATYEHNLHKVLQMAAKLDVERHQDKKGGGKRGLLGFLGRKK